MSEYSSDQIQVITGLQPVRKRPGMYIGNTDGSGLRNMVWELVDNVIALHMAGHATELRVELGPDTWITVRDDGSGIPTDLIPERAPHGGHPNQTHATADAPTSVLEAVFLRLHTCAPYGTHVPYVRGSGGLAGVGLSAVNALSKRLEVETTYRGVRWSQAFERGERATPLRRHGPSSLEGTTIRFQPNPRSSRRPQLTTMPSTRVSNSSRG